ncbi:hypothetical protein [Bradyrhizobium sp.]|uniref:hypothetical protein n=1 Tax=Bradyrhizobium sp. TaxID=376 RepID=UPI002D301C78|nr:hypothetical protein [Bradyrhizobium sp.]HZR74557.1 hypothetical protein [Bradyrhizobium sp.]
MSLLDPPTDSKDRKPSRQRLPDRRASERFDFEFSGTPFSATISRFANGQLGEIFIDCHKVGSALGILAADAAILASIALQHGADLDTLRHALSRDVRGNPTSPLGVALEHIGDMP